MWADAPIDARRPVLDRAALSSRGWQVAGLALLLAMFVLIEDDRSGGPLLNFPGFYGPLPRVPALRVTDLIVGGFGAALLLSALRGRRQLHGLGRLTWPMLLLAFAIVVGLIAGVMSPDADRSALVGAARPIIYLAVLPWLIVNVRGPRGWERTLLEALAWLVIAKALLGLAGLLVAPAATPGGPLTVTYYQPLANWLSMLYILYVVAAVAARARIAPFIAAGFPLVVLSLVLSYRRSFWMATLAGLVVIGAVYLAQPRLRRRRSDPRRGWLGGITLAALGLVVTLAFTGALPTDAVDPVRERALSISTSKIAENSVDSYRIGEQANIIEQLRSTPFIGLGFGVRWEATKPLALQFRNSRLYSHVVVTSLWLKMGLLGVIAYLLLMGAGVAHGVALWAREGKPEVAACGLALAAGLVGMAVAETTASFTGVDARVSATLGILLGLAMRAGRHRVTPRPL